MTPGDPIPPSVSFPLRCSNCGRPPPEGTLPHRCPVCRGLYDLAPVLSFSPAGQGPRRGLERFRHMLHLPASAALVTLGEGGTPLVGVKIHGRDLFFKCEHLNPTGSFKDRGTAVLVSHLAAAGVTTAVEDSSGNAGSSFAAYAARAGIAARVFVPDTASAAKRAQIAEYGAQVVRIIGPRTAVAEAVLRAAASGPVYASHAYLPLGKPGLATLAYEIVEQLGRQPGSVVVPVGQGTLALGCAAGFEAMRRAGAIEQVPALIGVQAEACAPIYAVHAGGRAGLEWVREAETRAEGIRIFQPLRGDEVLAAIERSGGFLLAVREDQILEGEHELARLGFYVEPTSAVVWPAVLDSIEKLIDPVVLVLTGSGYKRPVDAAGA